MSDLPKRLQEQAAANQKGLAYKQANARTARAARQQVRKRPSDAVEEKKKRKPVAAVQDEIGFRFIFTSDFIDTTADDAEAFPEGLSVPGIFKRDYDALVADYGDGWPMAMVQLQDLPPYLKTAGFGLGQLSPLIYYDFQGYFDPEPGFISKRFDLLGSLDGSLFPERLEQPIAGLDISFVGTTLIESQGAQLGPTNLALHDDVSAEFSEAIQEGNAVICFEDALLWNVPAWPNPLGDTSAFPFYPQYFGENNTIFDSVRYQLLDFNDLQVAEQYTPTRLILNNLSEFGPWTGPKVDFHSFRSKVVRSCQAASDNGAVVLVFPRVGWNTQDNSGGLMYKGFYKGLSGVDQGGYDMIFDLLQLGVNALDYSVELVDRPIFSNVAEYIWRPAARQVFQDFVAKQHLTALAIEASLSNDTKFLVAIQHRTRGAKSLFDASDFYYIDRVGDPFQLYRSTSNRFASNRATMVTPYKALHQFLIKARAASYFWRQNSRSEYWETDVFYDSEVTNLTFFDGLTEEDVRKIADIERVKEKALALAGVAFLGPEAELQGGSPQLQLD